jgi:hypothetical protein
MAAAGDADDTAEAGDARLLARGDAAGGADESARALRAAEDSIRALRAAFDNIARSAFVASPRNCASAALSARWDGCFECLRVRFFDRDGAFAGRGWLRSATVLDGRAVLIGRSGTACCAPPVAFCAPLLAALVVLSVDATSDAVAFWFFLLGIEALDDARIDERQFGQLQLRLESEDNAGEGRVMRAAELFAPCARLRARQPALAARVDGNDGDAKMRQGVREARMHGRGVRRF